jgi:hypothetical protein
MFLVYALLSCGGSGSSDNNSASPINDTPPLNDVPPINTAPSVNKTSNIRMTNEGSSFRITNEGSSEVGFNLLINGKSFFATVEDVINDIQSMPSDYPDEPAYRKLWRYLIKNRYHFESYTDSVWGHSPVLMLNSLGFGFCDDVASVYYFLATKMGYQARIWNIISADSQSGHVIPEVLIQNRWEMYDPDLEVYYWNEQGQVAGVEELSHNTQLITEPINPFPLSHFSDLAISAYEPSVPYAYSQYIAYVYYVYSGVYHHKIDTGYYVQVGFPTYDTPFSLPPKAYLEFPVQSDIVLRSESGDDVPSYHIMRLMLPKGWSGSVRVPFVFLSVRGSGRISLNDTHYDLDSPAVANRLLIHNDIYEASIQESYTDIEILLLVNKTRFDLDNILSLDIRETKG